MQHVCIGFGVARGNTWSHGPKSQPTSPHWTEWTATEEIAHNREGTPNMNDVKDVPVAVESGHLDAMQNLCIAAASVI